MKITPNQFYQNRTLLNDYAKMLCGTISSRDTKYIFNEDAIKRREEIIFLLRFMLIEYYKFDYETALEKVDRNFLKNIYLYEVVRKNFKLMVCVDDEIKIDELPIMNIELILAIIYEKCGTCNKGMINDMKCYEFLLNLNGRSVKPVQREIYQRKYDAISLFVQQEIEKYKTN